MRRDVRFENEIVIATVQALLGVITPEMRAIAVEVDESAATATLHVALWRQDPTLLELLRDVADDINIHSHDAVAVRVQPWVGGDWTREWPGREHRRVFAARGSSEARP